MLIKRTLEKIILEKLKTSDKAIVIYGARQVGKTTLVKEIIKNTSYKTLYIDADEEKYLDILTSRDSAKMKLLVGDYDLVVIDEAQRIPNVGINLKILIDHFPQLKIIITGSSSFELADKISEPLTGRVWSYKLYPIAYLELKNQLNYVELNSSLEERLVFGSYPEIFNLKNIIDKKKYLEEISHSYLYKDILQLANIKHIDKIKKLLKLLAFQVGSEVSLTELGNNLDLSKETVANYIESLKKSFIIFSLGGLSRNLRKEVAKMDKIYFYDLGIRNVLIDNLKFLSDRNDVGQIWENFLMIERMKLLSYRQVLAERYFWRTYTGAEIDLVEEREGKLFGYEFKWGEKIVKAPKTWLETYNNAQFKTINTKNYLDYITKK